MLTTSGQKKMVPRTNFEKIRARVFVYMARSRPHPSVTTSFSVRCRLNSQQQLVEVLPNACTYRVLQANNVQAHDNTQILTAINAQLSSDPPLSPHRPVVSNLETGYTNFFCSWRQFCDFV